MTAKLSVPKEANVVNHTHLDCVPRHRDLVAKASKLGFQKFAEPFPEETVSLAETAKLLVGGAERLHEVGGKEYKQLHAMARKLYRQATAAYRKDCYDKAHELAAYCAIIAKQICPLMQTPENMAFFTREYIKDLIADHTIGAQIRYAPHLHLDGGMKLEQTVESVAEVTSQAPIPIKLILGVLRGPDNEQNRKVAREIRRLCVRYDRYVGAMDLCGAEGLYPGVLNWYFYEAVRAFEESGGKVLPTLHIAETAKLPEPEVERIKRNAVRAVGHFLWNDDHELYQECCPDSNVLIKAHPDIKHFRDHNIARKLKEGQHVMLSTDGTTLIRTSMRSQMAKGRRVFAWTNADLYRLNMNAVDGGYYDEPDKAKMRKQLAVAWGQE